MAEESDYSSSISSPPFQPPPPAADPLTAELVALRRLSSNLEWLLHTPSHADAHITLPTPHPPLPVHRCVLSARSPFFRDLFARRDDHLRAADLLPSLPVGPDAIQFVLAYIYTGRVSQLPRGSSCCADESCLHVACRPAVSFMLEVLYSSSVFQISELVNLFQRHLLDILPEVREEDFLAVLSVANLCGKSSCERLLTRCADLVVRSSHDVVTLEKAGLPQALIEEIMAARGPEASAGGEPSIHAKKILRALDSDDVELLNLLLWENTATTLDDAHALHYTVAHCDPKVVSQLLELGQADVNLRDKRGHTALHVAAMRKEPKIIISLLNKGASPLETTPDGRKAVQMARQVTKDSEYSTPPERGTEAPNGRLCIEILENAEAGGQEGAAGVPAKFADIFANAGKDFKERFSYLETRVTFAKLLFPAEATIAMENAKVNGTSEFRLGTQCDALPGNQQADIEDILMFGPRSSQRDTQVARRAIELAKTIETAKRFFPRCTRVIDKYMDHDTVDWSEAPEEDKQLKRKRYKELEQEINEAFYKDKEALNASSSSASTLNGPHARSARHRG